MATILEESEMKHQPSRPAPPALVLCRAVAGRRAATYGRIATDDSGGCPIRFIVRFDL